jgi:prevent-host-death family protein
MDVSIRELKNRLSEYLRRVQAGEQVTVTLRGKRIARLSAVIEQDDKRDPVTEAIERLNTMPWVHPSSRTGKPRGARRPIKAQPGEKLTEKLLERE